MKYLCKECNFETVRKANYMTHINATKHRNNVNGTVINNELDNQKYELNKQLNKNNPKLILVQNVFLQEKLKDKESEIVVLKDNVKLYQTINNEQKNTNHNLNNKLKLCKNKLNRCQTNLTNSQKRESALMVMLSKSHEN